MRFEIKVKVEEVHGIAILDENMNLPKIIGQVSCTVGLSRNKCGERTQPSLPISIRRGRSEDPCDDNNVGFSAKWPQNSEFLKLDTKLDYLKQKTFEVSVMLSRGSKDILLGIASLKFIGAVLEADVYIPIHLIGSPRAIEILIASKTRYQRNFLGRQETVRDSFFQSNPYTINSGIQSVCFKGGDNNRRYSLSQGAFIKLKCSCLPKQKIYRDFFNDEKDDTSVSTISVLPPPKIAQVPTATDFIESIYRKHARTFDLTIQQSSHTQDLSTTMSQISSIGLNLQNGFTDIEEMLRGSGLERDAKYRSRGQEDLALDIKNIESSLVVARNEQNQISNYLSLSKHKVEEMLPAISSKGNSNTKCPSTNCRAFENQTKCGNARWYDFFFSIIECANDGGQTSFDNENAEGSQQIPTFISSTMSTSVDVSELTTESKKERKKKLFLSITEHTSSLHQHDKYANPLDLSCQKQASHIPPIISMEKSRSVDISELAPSPEEEEVKFERMVGDLGLRKDSNSDEEKIEDRCLQKNQEGWDFRSIGTSIVKGAMAENVVHLNTASVPNINQQSNGDSKDEVWDIRSIDSSILRSIRQDGTISNPNSLANNPDTLSVAADKVIRTQQNLIQGVTRSAYKEHLEEKKANITSVSTATVGGAPTWRRISSRESIRVEPKKSSGDEHLEEKKANIRSSSTANTVPSMPTRSIASSRPSKVKPNKSSSDVHLDDRNANIRSDSTATVGSPASIQSLVSSISITYAPSTFSAVVSRNLTEDEIKNSFETHGTKSYNTDERSMKQKHTLQSNYSSIHTHATINVHSPQNESCSRAKNY